MSSRIDKNSVSRLTMISLEKKKTPLILGFHHALNPASEKEL
jgi:hypothetical protein